MSEQDFPRVISALADCGAFDTHALTHVRLAMGIQTHDLEAIIKRAKERTKSPQDRLLETDLQLGDIQRRAERGGTTVEKGRLYDADVMFLIGLVRSLAVPAALSQEEREELKELRELKNNVDEFVGKLPFRGPTA